METLAGNGSRVISRNLILEGYGQMFGGGCKHAGSANLHYKTLKNAKKYK